MQQQSWKEVLPGDQYTVQINGILHFYDQKIITRLYQPLIGIGASCLYTTLWHEVDEASFSTDALTHHHLMTELNLPLDTILEERKKLEAIGLLKTHKKTEENVSFIYELQPPLSPHVFFTDGLLNIYLYNRVGGRDYARLKKMFSHENSLDESYKDVTAKFNDVFESKFKGHKDYQSTDIETIPEHRVWDGRSDGQVPTLRETFDFDLLFQYLSDVIISKEAFTKEAIDTVEKLAFVYKLDPLDMSRIIQSAFLHTGEIDIELLRKAVRDDYQFKQGQSLPALSQRTQPLQHREMASKEPKTDEERLIQQYETLSPYDILEQLSGGAKPAAPDLRLIEEIMLDQKLNAGVVNVLIHYVMITSDYKLIKNHVLKIAAQWARKQVKTVRQAMDLAKHEQEKYDEWKTNQTKTKNTSRKNNRKEKLPKWMDKKEDGGQHSTLSKEEAAKQEEWLRNYLNDI
ncbi:replication initiation and membrane attachment family protein [Terrilactibacillus laevilacticus]|uniref:replication initiation and membrane attachment family protein n=1 Tax=Terrilactibacillus laevilacticus TaxID=1380157 RepID=UPI001146B946|nr:DnaD domain protein [Terrilactibacillus laevilacticus]